MPEGTIARIHVAIGSGSAGKTTADVKRQGGSYGAAEAGGICRAAENICRSEHANRTDCRNDLG